MKKINLSEAKKILEQQGYTLKIKYDEALLERYNILEDLFEYFYFNEDTQCYYESDLLTGAIQSQLQEHKDLLKQKFVKYYDDNETICDTFWNIIRALAEMLLDKSLSEFDFNPSDKSVEYVKELARRNELESRFCVLHINSKTSEQLNQVELAPLKEAILMYNGSVPVNSDDRIELRYYPEEDEFLRDNLYNEIVIMAYKGGIIND